MNKEQIEEFEKFLKGRRILTKFKAANSRKGHNLTKYYEEEDYPSQVLSGAFTWRHSTQGHVYWSNVNQAWQSHCRKLEKRYNESRERN
jgi:hypothetical protein